MPALNGPDIRVWTCFRCLSQTVLFLFVPPAVGQPMPYNYLGGAPPRANGTLTAEQLQVLQIRNTSNPRQMIQQQQQQQRASGLQQPINTLDGFAGRLPAQLDQQQLNSILLQQLQNGIAPNVSSLCVLICSVGLSYVQLERSLYKAT